MNSLGRLGGGAPPHGAILRLHKSLLPKHDMMYSTRIVCPGIIFPMIDRFPVSLFETAFPRKRKVDDLCGRLAFNVNIFRQIGHKRVDSRRVVGKLQNVCPQMCSSNNNKEARKYGYKSIQ